MSLKSVLGTVEQQLQQDALSSSISPLLCDIGIGMHVRMAGVLPGLASRSLFDCQLRGNNSNVTRRYAPAIAAAKMPRTQNNMISAELIRPRV